MDKLYNITVNKRLDHQLSFGSVIEQGFSTENVC